jgi:crossover junction endodeoxyribonuclease RusA
MPRFTIPGIPVAQPRQRHRIVGTYVQNYTPTKHPVNAFKAAAQLAASQVFDEPLGGPVMLKVVFVMPRPKNLIWKSRPMPRLPKVTKPDCENILKALMDALTGIAWRDDVQVWTAWVTKWIAAGDEAPHTEVEIME